ncbi:MAG: site-2 protease family protein [Thermoanaerobaculia bacterium]
MIYLGVLLLLSLLIVVHEAGHLLAAKLVGIPVDSFSVGLGPKVWARRWGRIEYAVRVFPLGGFVVPAMDEEEMRAVPLVKRIVFFLGGPLANLALCLPLFAWMNFSRHGASLFQLAIAPFLQVGAACRALLAFLSGALARPDSVSGVVGIVVEGGRAAHQGMALELAVSLSLSLAILNLLPIPVLDGGQIVMSCLESAFPPLVRLRAPLTLTGVLLLGTLMIFVNLRDVAHYLGA